MVEVRESDIHGKGVFATKIINSGFEFSCDVLPIKSENITIDLENHIFPYFGGKEKCICIGFPTYFNHSKTPNVKILKLDREKQIKTFITLSDINIGEELTLYYNVKFNETT